MTCRKAAFLLGLAAWPLLRGGEQAAAMGRAGYAWAQAEASFRTMAERYHGLYDVSSDLSSAAMALQGRVS